MLLLELNSTREHPPDTSGVADDKNVKCGCGSSVDALLAARRYLQPLFAICHLLLPQPIR
jgi:hypothetical protein